MRPFAGVGVFTAQAPLSASLWRGVASKAAVRPDLVSPGDVDVLRGEGLRVATWEANTYTGGLLPGTFGYIGQAEGPEQKDRVLALPIPPGTPKALVGEPDYAAVPGWLFLCECYDSAVPPRGYFGVSWFPVLDLISHPFSDYVASLAGRRNFWVWDADECPPANVAAVRRYLGL